MTSVEKEMNKDELIAYKNFDNKDLTLVPGSVSSKQFADPRPQKYSPQNKTNKAPVAVNEDKIQV